MSENQEIVKVEPLVVKDNSEFSLLLDTAKFEQGQRAAKLLAASTRIPEQFQGKPADCFLMLQMASQLKMHPVMLMQKSYVVHGKPGMEAQLVIALMNQNGPFDGPVQFKESGTVNQPGYKMTAFATHKETKKLYSFTLTYEMVKAEGWLDKLGSKWKTLGPLMYQYRSAVYLCNTVCPEVKFGYSTVEELEDIGPHPLSPDPAPGPAPVEERLAKVVLNEAQIPVEIKLQDPVKEVVPDLPV
jgi:hypothetical protein